MDLPLKSVGRLAWSRSVLATHPKASVQKPALSLAAVALAIKERFQFIESRAISLDTSRPRLPRPKPPALGSFQPARYFSKGPRDLDPKNNPEPIWYLLTESLESPTARPVPHNSALIKSLCKGRGRLRQSSQGLIYLDIDNQFITSMMPYLRLQGLIRPPYFNLFGKSEGAHIPVIPRREAGFHFLRRVQEFGREFSFEIEGLYSLKPDTWPEVEEVWFFTVNSPELEALRRRYFLTSLPGGHSFHIAVAIQPRSKENITPRPVPLMRINVACLAA